MIAPIKSDILTYSFDPDMEEEKPVSVYNIRKEHPNAYKLWEREEELELIDLYNSGKSIEEIAESLGRNKGGIKARIGKLGIISDDLESTKKRVNGESKYPVKNEHLIEPNLWGEEKKSRSIDGGTPKENEAPASLPVIQKGGIKSAFRKLGKLISKVGSGK